MYIGDEKLLFNGKKLPYSVIDYWRVNLSELLLNVTRGGFAEFLVLCALDDAGFNALTQSKTGMEAWDVDGPEITVNGFRRRSRIEVKSTASVQVDTPDEKEPISLQPNKLVFSIRPAIDFASSDQMPRRNNDLYVFAHYKAERKSDNILDLDFWDFYVYPTFKIEEDPVVSEQKTISVRRLQMLGISPCKFDKLYAEIRKCLDEIENRFSSVKDEIVDIESL